ncbi:hypothetical protein TrST_g13067 [Triparma strigata]|uniref:Large ribosomal subunit protein uL24c n=2 Tax=Triparma TaxID=722752 RepID=A0A9W7APL4_9STRA|nr:hypothetical protein TrST_g13067 [Triparma strigata]
MRLLKKLMTPKVSYKPQLSSPNALPKKFSILRGDTVEVINGPCTGERGIVSSVLRKNARLIIEGVNVRSRKLKSNPARGLSAKVQDKAVSVHYSNVNLVCPVMDKPTRISRKYLEDGTKVRVSKLSGAIIPRPLILSERRRPQRTELTEKETKEEDVFEVTYDPERKGIKG